jgi:hypothetical protein
MTKRRNRQTMVCKTPHRTPRIEQKDPHWKTWVNSDITEIIKAVKLL